MSLYKVMLVCEWEAPTADQAQAEALVALAEPYEGPSVVTVAEDIYDLPHPAQIWIWTDDEGILEEE